MTDKTSASGQTQVSKHKTATPYDADYSDFEIKVAARIGALNAHAFTTDADPDAMWAAYLAGFPDWARQHYNCNHCRHFVQRFGGLVTITDEGYQVPLAWPDPNNVSPFFASVVRGLGKLVLGSKVNGMFSWDAGKTWGVPQTGVWSHLSGMPNAAPPRRPLKDAEQTMAEVREGHGVLCRSLADYGEACAAEAVRVLEHADALARAEKALAMAQWYLALHLKLKGCGKRSDLRHNVTWLVAATAPAGWCHVKNTILGTLLQDVKDGMPYETVRRRWAEKMHPLQYQRPQAEPSDGAVKQAEEIFDKLGLAPALGRRACRLEEVVRYAIWKPSKPDEEVATDARAKCGVFDHLRKKRGHDAPVEQMTLPPVTITWERFQRTVLPTAAKMQYRLPSGYERAAYYGMLTATDPDAPPILQWDGVALRDPTDPAHVPDRNPVSWYFHIHGSTPSDWGVLDGRAWTDVNAILLPPHQWQVPEQFKHQPMMAMLVLDGWVAQDPKGLGLFPEIMRAELHAVRKVIEAHSNTMSFTEPDKGTANGVAFQKDVPVKVTVRVWVWGRGWESYVIDRWE